MAKKKKVLGNLFGKIDDVPDKFFPGSTPIGDRTVESPNPALRIESIASCIYGHLLTQVKKEGLNPDQDAKKAIEFAKVLIKHLDGLNG